MRILKILAIIIGVFIAAIASIDLFFKYSNPFPLLAAGLPNNVREAENEFSQRVKERFPLGSSEAALRAALMQEGWGEALTHNGQYYVKFTRSASPIIRQSATIVWRADEHGRLTEIVASYGIIAP